VALADRDLVDADRLGSGRSCFGELRAHVLHLQRLDRVPVEPELVRDALHRRLPAAAADVESKALRVKWVVGEELQLFAFHGAAAPAIDAPDLELQVDARVAAGEVAHPPRTPVVPARMHATAAATDRFFGRRTRVITRALGSPNTPRTAACGRNPGKA
jgi:hypothetical protein